MRKGIIAKCIVMVFVLSMTLCGCSSRAKTEMRFGTAGNGGTYYDYGTKLSEFVHADYNAYTMNVKTTAGSAANVRLLSKDFLDVAIVQSDILESASAGTGMFSKTGKYKGYSAVAALYTEACQIVVLKDAGITSVADLKGKSISVGEEESGVRQNAEQILMNYGMTFDSVDAHYMSISDSADAMRLGNIDAFFYTSGAPTKAIEELAEDVDIEILSIDSADISRMQGLYKGYVACTIPAGTYKGQTKDVETIGVKAVLVANNDCDQEVVKLMLTSLMKHAEQLSGYVCTDDAITDEFATTGVPIAFHSGAAAYYSEKGIEVTIDAGSKSNSVIGSQDN